MKNKVTNLIYIQYLKIEILYIIYDKAYDMDPQKVNLIREAAILLEKTNLQMAHDLMALAHENRPHGPVIKEKLDEYRSKLKSYQKLKEIFDSGELVIIPAGFRCQTKMSIDSQLGLKQASLPFDSGFFSPYSVDLVLKNKKIELSYPEENNKTHNVCIKLENYNDSSLGKGIKFERATYDEINQLAKDKNQKDINCYLDSTFGFYTLDNKNKFVLAHYNWHHFSDGVKSKGIYDRSINISNINDILNKRITRMFELCHKAKYVIFAFGEFQDYKYMAIDNDIYPLNDFNLLSKTALDIFGNKCLVTNFSDINTANKLLEKIRVNTL